MMFRAKLYFVTILFLVGISSLSICRQNNAVVQIKAFGRFGDNLISMAHAIYFSYKNHCKLLYDPFIYSDQLVLSEKVKPYFPGIEGAFTSSIIYPGGSGIIPENVSRTLFKIPYFPEAPIEYKGKEVWNYFPTQWDDPQFKRILRKLIAPKYTLALIEPRRDKVSVAVHIRKGGGFEHDIFNNTNNVYAGLITYKFPYEEYYIQQIKKLSELLNHIPLYVFLFTDDQSPQELIQRYEKLVGIPSIEFDCRKTGNRHDKNVLEDLFSMSKFDMLIRPESSFSIMAEKLGDFSLVISPADLLPGTVVHGGLVNIKASISK
jgi:hypothetical protein